MVMGDWGLDSHSFRVRGVHSCFGSVDSDDPAAIPEVQAALEQGYEPAPEAPMWCFLPAIWPDHARAWVRDTRVRHSLVSCGGEPDRRVPWSAADYADIESETNMDLVACGVPPRPAGRLWLLKPPPGFDRLEETLCDLDASATAAGQDDPASVGYVTHIDLELQHLFTPRG